MFKMIGWVVLKSTGQSLTSLRRSHDLPDSD